MADRDGGRVSFSRANRDRSIRRSQWVYRYFLRWYPLQRMVGSKFQVTGCRSLNISASCLLQLQDSRHCRERTSPRQVVSRGGNPELSSLLQGDAVPRPVTCNLKPATYRTTPSSGLLAVA